MSDGWVFFWGCLGVIAASVVLIAGIFAAVKPLNESACNQKGGEYGLPADYRFLSDACYVELNNGRRIDVEQIRGVEEGR